MKKTAAAVIAILCAISLSACEGKMQKMSNAELSEKNAECVRKSPTSPGRVTACENIRKECEARRDDGNYAC
ncbi:hypothetical protein [Agaribacterium sp. ZY112]|uniref:hypothetical protein n=1 Tax=Agaribacterium sp. ZY112 TaxID=3233574 RepID=UPI00352561A5